MLEIKLMADPDTTVISFTSSEFNIYKIKSIIVK